MAMRSLMVFLLPVTFSGCIVTYHDFPGEHSLPSIPVTPALASCHQTIEFSYGLAEESSSSGGTYQWTYSGVLSPPNVARVMEDALQQAAGCSSDIVYTTWPRTKVVVHAQEKPYPWHWYGELLGQLASTAYFVIPFYINEGGWEFSYSVYHRDRLTKTYKYDLTPRQLYWALLVPFSWINVFTDSLEDAVQATTVQFVMDAQRDGYLMKTN
ncbi:MAG: hypothetical protein OJF51_002442 [Nitrospira sp.]|jgi:hypothetical protein|nr:MAG: hypothetical protein OJF51_002442 [Nitrospira sp.]